MLTLKLKEQSCRKSWIKQIRNKLDSGQDLKYNIDKSTLLKIQLAIIKGELDYKKVVLNFDGNFNITFDEFGRPSHQLPSDLDLEIAREILSLQFEKAPGG